VPSPHYRNRKPRFRTERTGVVLITLVAVALLALWSLRPSRPAPPATFVPPTETPAALPPPPAEPAEGCTIKGNISKKGEKIYHLPGQNFYEKTIVSPEDGERWFCTETEAQAAGWRKSKV
jgi:hypothetical protein